MTEEFWGDVDGDPIVPETLPKRDARKTSRAIDYAVPDKPIDAACVLPVDDITWGFDVKEKM